MPFSKGVPKSVTLHTISACSIINRRCISTPQTINRKEEDDALAIFVRPEWLFQPGANTVFYDLKLTLGQYVFYTTGYTDNSGRLWYRYGKYGYAARIDGNMWGGM